MCYAGYGVVCLINSSAGAVRRVQRPDITLDTVPVQLVAAQQLKSKLRSRLAIIGRLCANDAGGGYRERQTRPAQDTAEEVNVQVQPSRGQLSHLATRL